LKACCRFSVSVTTPRASWLRKTTGSSRSSDFAVGAGPIDTEGAFTGFDVLNATAEIPNLKSEKFSFRLRRLATSSGELGRLKTMRSLLDYSEL
jgi:hypothetical protein